PLGQPQPEHTHTPPRQLGLAASVQSPSMLHSAHAFFTGLHTPVGAVHDGGVPATHAPVVPSQVSDPSQNAASSHESAPLNAPPVQSQRALASSHAGVVDNAAHGSPACCVHCPPAHVSAPSQNTASSHALPSSSE